MSTTLKVSPGLGIEPMPTQDDNLFAKQSSDFKTIQLVFQTYFMTCPDPAEIQVAVEVFNRMVERGMA